MFEALLQEENLCQIMSLPLSLSLSLSLSRSLETLFLMTNNKREAYTASEYLTNIQKHGRQKKTSKELSQN